MIDSPFPPVQEISLHRKCKLCGDDILIPNSDYCSAFHAKIPKTIHLTIETAKHQQCRTILRWWSLTLPIEIRDVVVESMSDNYTFQFHLDYGTLASLLHYLKDSKFNLMTPILHGAILWAIHEGQPMLVTRALERQFRLRKT